MKLSGPEGFQNALTAKCAIQQFQKFNKKLNTNFVSELQTSFSSRRLRKWVCCALSDTSYLYHCTYNFLHFCSNSFYIFHRFYREKIRIKITKQSLIVFGVHYFKIILYLIRQLILRSRRASKSSNEDYISYLTYFFTEIQIWTAFCRSCSCSGEVKSNQLNQSPSGAATYKHRFWCY